MTTRLPFRHITSLASVHRIGVFRNVSREQNWIKSHRELLSRWRIATISSAVEMDEVVGERSEPESTFDAIKEPKTFYGRLKFRSETVNALKEAEISSLTEIQVLYFPVFSSLFRFSSLNLGESNTSDPTGERCLNSISYRLRKDLRLSATHCEFPVYHNFIVMLMF